MWQLSAGLMHGRYFKHNVLGSVRKAFRSAKGLPSSYHAMFYLSLQALQTRCSLVCTGDASDNGASTNEHNTTYTKGLLSGSVSILYRDDRILRTFSVWYCLHVQGLQEKASFAPPPPPLFSFLCCRCQHYLFAEQGYEDEGLQEVANAASFPAIML